MFFVLLICTAFAFPYTDEQNTIIAKRIALLGKKLSLAGEEVANHKAEIDALMTKISEKSIDFASANEQLGLLNQQVADLIKGDGLETKAPAGDKFIDLDGLYEDKKVAVKKAVKKAAAKMSKVKKTKKLAKVAKKAAAAKKKAAKLAKKGNKKAAKKAAKKAIKLAKKATKANKKINKAAKNKKAKKAIKKAQKKVAKLQKKAEKKQQKKAKKIAKSVTKNLPNQMPPRVPYADLKKAGPALVAKAKKAARAAFKKVMVQYQKKVVKENNKTMKDAKGKASFKDVVADAKKAQGYMLKAKRMAKIAAILAFRKVIYSKKGSKPLCVKPIIVAPVELVFPYSKIPSIRKAQILMNKHWCQALKREWSLN